MEYIDNLRQLIDKQVDEFIKKELRDQDIDNNTRKTDLMELGPLELGPATETNATKLVKQTLNGQPQPANNNPLYPANMIDRMNTPFDHIDRILLQDFAISYTDLNNTSCPIGIENYFKNLYTFRGNGEQGNDCAIKSIELSDLTSNAFNGTNIDYTPISDVLASYDDSDSKKFVVDSFTYTPFVDYATIDNKVGIYQDEYLTKFNTGWYDVKPGGYELKERNIDTSRHPITSTLFELGNLESDIYNAKISFREAITNVELSDDQERNGKVYIYRFCEHLASLFAKLSNIRMSHVIYGLHTPHLEWEGILALDIWYQFLYRSIDQQYPFNPDYLDRNPMSKLKIENNKVNYCGVEYNIGSSYDDIKIFTSDDDNTIETGYALLWDESLWQEYDSISNNISSKRHECVIPRYVLKKIYDIIYGTFPTNDIIYNSDGDFSWFKQDGKVYSDSSKSVFSKYANLHLGRAYEVMSPKEYHDLCGYNETSKPDPWAIREDGKITSYVKPTRQEHNPDQNITFYTMMLRRGCGALWDAFRVIKNERIFNIYNSNTKTIEVFKPENMRYYSQSQCAIVIERIFSRLYKYLSFKSTTSEIFHRHINIDTGYKYLTTSTLNKSQNPNSMVYYADVEQEGDPDYLIYLNKLKEYVTGGRRSSVLNAAEHKVIEQFISILSYTSRDWLDLNWNLCPEQAKMYQTYSMQARELTPRDTLTQTRKLVINLNLNNSMSLGTLTIPSWLSQNYRTRPTELYYTYYYDTDSADLSQISITPTYTHSGATVNYTLLGYSTNKNSKTPEYPTNVVFTLDKLNTSEPITTIYAIWRSGYIIDFKNGNRNDVVGTMTPMVVYEEQEVNLTPCGYSIPGKTKPEFTYYNDYSVNRSWEDVDTSTLTIEDKQLYQFSSWFGTFNGVTMELNDGALLSLYSEFPATTPLITLTAKWESVYDIVKFYVDGKQYCDVLIDKRDSILKSPQLSPIMTNPKRKFLNWGNMIGQTLSGVSISSDIVCGEPLKVGENDGKKLICQLSGGGSQNTLICYGETSESPVYGDGGIAIICKNDGSGNTTAISDFHIVELFEEDLIVCQSDGMSSYTTVINANIATLEDTKFGVNFIYLDKDEDDNVTIVARTEEVIDNSPLPQFHLHQNLMYNDQNHVFRYWYVQSGTISSDFTVLSPVTLVGVYDILEQAQQEIEPIEVFANRIAEQAEQEEADTYGNCPFAIYNEDGQYVSCGYGCNASNWSDYNPKSDIFDNDGGTKCPFIQLLKSTETFDTTGIILIQDVANLVKSLFKINIDIAHNEYFLKIDFQDDIDWWYGRRIGEKDDIVCTEPNPIETICNGEAADDNTKSISDNVNMYGVVCSYADDGELICEQTTYENPVVCSTKILGEDNWVSFEPTVEYKFSNLHASNQEYDGTLICTVDESKERDLTITPINRELLDEYGYHYNQLYYFYDYWNSLKDIHRISIDDGSSCSSIISGEYNRINKDKFKYYSIDRLCPQHNTSIQSPVDPNDFISGRLDPIDRTNKQVQTYVSIVKKYRPIIVPNVRDIFNKCINDKTKYQVDKDNEYGVFGWCTIPSKTMVNMEYNENSIIIPSSYDHYNRVCGSNFLQLDKDFGDIYKICDDGTNINSNISNSWYYLYNTRDWTYFLEPFFGIKPNNTVYSYMLDTYPTGNEPRNSNHLNGIIFEPSIEGRNVDVQFGDTAKCCQYLAKYTHHPNNLKLISKDFTKLFTFEKLKELTGIQDESEYEFNSKYGSAYESASNSYRYSETQMIDDFNKTGAYIGDAKYDNTYKYNIGQSQSIDDFNDDSVWFYITMTSPLEEQVRVIEIEDIMPYVFWWSNRGYA